jgi:eukaryotic-like serine/threonine-protein kinase
VEYESLSGEGQSYRLGRRLKAGSTGDVFETTHPLLPGPCAIKIVRPELVDRPEAVEAFRADVNTVAALRHPHIVHVIEVGSLPDVPPFVVMELLEGRLLGEQLAGHRTVPLDEAIEIVKAVAAALQAAHNRGVVHGEVNPGNVYLARVEGYDRGLVKLLNFGIYRLRRVDSPALLTVEATRYLSPEQAAGRAEEVDGRSDQFALAALSYRMLSGVDSFLGETAISLLDQIVHHPPALERPAEVNADVEAVVRRGLAKDKSERFESVLSFARAFESAARGSAEATTAAGGTAAHPIRAVPAEVKGRSPEPGAMTMPGFAGERSAGNHRASPHEIAQSGSARRRVDAPAAAASRPAAAAAPGRAPAFRVSPQRTRRDKTDSLLMEPFFTAYREDQPRGDTLDLEADLAGRAPRQGWKLMLFVIGVAIATFAASLAVGWRPPLSWRQSQMWHDLGLPGAASGMLPPAQIR